MPNGYDELRSRRKPETEAKRMGSNPFCFSDKKIINDKGKRGTTLNTLTLGESAVVRTVRTMIVKKLIREII